MRASLSLLLLLAACAASPRGDAGGGPADANLHIQTEFDPASPDPVEGGVGLFTVTVRNASKQFVILRDLALPDGTPILTWESPPPRALGYDSRSDEFRAESGPRSPAEAVQIGLLLPGESILFRPRVRLLQLPRRYTLNYLSYSAQELAPLVYFEVPGGGTLRYRRLPAPDLATLIPMKEVQGTHRSVIFPHAHSPVETPLSLALVLDVRAAPRQFRLADALRRAALAPGEVEESTYCLYLDAWAVRSRNRSLLVTPRGTSPLPQITRFELCFFYLDLMEPSLPVQFEFTGSLDVRFPDRKIDPLPGARDRPRKLAFIPREEVPAFLKEVADKELEIDVRPDGRVITLVLRSRALGAAPTFAWEDARRKAGLDPKDILEHVWSEAIGAWALRAKSGAYFVSERGGGKLPPIEWFAYFFRRLDEQAALGDVKFTIPPEELDAFPFAPGGLVKGADLARFLSVASERGLKIDVGTPGQATVFRLKR